MSLWRCEKTNSRCFLSNDLSIVVFPTICFRHCQLCHPGLLRNYNVKIASMVCNSKFNFYNSRKLNYTLPTSCEDSWVCSNLDPGLRSRSTVGIAHQALMLGIWSYFTSCTTLYFLLFLFHFTLDSPRSSVPHNVRLSTQTRITRKLYFKIIKKDKIFMNILLMCNCCFPWRTLLFRGEEHLSCKIKFKCILL